ncbi:cytochrome c oxidase subunit V [Auriculariales sp. MPI-PUGE-AT-0066]|nr:cytochrome c oxidase subunit V [Auriculariales sp. MPI-PUGE-AT-0066]
MQALRLARPRGPLQHLLRLSTHAPAAAAAPSAASRVRSASVIPLSNVEAQWDAMNSDEQLEVHRQLETLQKQDWKSLSSDEKKAAYYIAFGPHGPRTPTNPPGTSTKVFLATMGAIGVAGAVFLFFRSLAPPAPRTMTREWQEETNRIALERKQDPITGSLSSWSAGPNRIASEGYKGEGHIQSK